MRLSFTHPRADRNHVSVDLLSAYLDGQVSAVERGRVHAHLVSCTACRSELDSLRQTVALVRALPRVSVPRAFTLSEVQAGIRRPAARPAWLGGALRGLAAVMAMALVVALGSVLVRQFGSRPAQQVALAPAPTMAAAARVVEKPAAAPQPPEAASFELVVTSPAVAVQATVVVEKAVEKVVQAPTGRAAAPTKASPPPSPPPQPATKAPAPVAAAPAPTAVMRAAEATVPAKLTAASPSPEPPREMRATGLGDESRSADQTLSGVTSERLPATVAAGLVLPDRAGVAYADPQGLWTLDRATGARQIVQGAGIAAPAISPDRTWLAYRLLRGDHFELWVVRWDGQDGRRLLAERELPKDDLPPGYSERRFGDVRWIPGRPVLALNVTVVPVAGDLLPRLEIWTVDAQTGASRPVVKANSFGRLAFSPDGQRLALLQPGTDRGPEGSLALYNADGTAGRPVLKFARGANPRSYESQLSWLPDGQSLWVAIPDTADSPGRLNGVTLYRVTADGQAKTVGHIDAFDTFWSPDGARLAYTRAVADLPETRELWLANADGTAGQRYAQLRNGGFINWSPDGGRFLYADAGQVYLGQPGRPAQRMGDITGFFDPHWIAANQLLYLHDLGTAWMLTSCTVDGPAASLWLLPREATCDVTRP